MKQWDKGQQVIFEENPDYYGEEPKIKKLTVLFMEEDAALAAAMAGEVDVAHTAASYSDQSVEGYELFSVQTVDNRGFNLPCSTPQEKDGVTYGNEFTSDVNVRRAINIGIDRQEMIDNVLNGYGTAAYSVCDKMPWYNPESEVEYDPEEAKKILEDAGWKKGTDGIRKKDGVRAEFTLMFSNGDSVRQALAASSLEESYDLWQKAQWDGTTGITQEGDIPWIWLCNIDHLYFVRDGLQIAEQKIHPHGHGWSIVNNVDQWSWE